MDSHTELTADVYFLIQRFLSSGPLRKTLKLLNEELEEYKILPKRLDWEGNEHERTVDDMERQFPYIRPDYLLQLCYQATNSADKALSINKNITSFLSFKPKVLNQNKVLYNFNQFCNYVIRHHVHNSNNSFNIVNMLRGRGISGPQARKHTVPTNLYSSIQIQRITLGHLSAVYCILFDQSGNYIVTGADDLLIKLWSAHTGRLIASFRGASSEITDIAINVENTLLAAGSIDRILRVWSLQTGAPLAVLTGHTGMITSVNFCPTSCWGLRYLITTSSDGSVAFWTYVHDGNKVDFRLKPIIYQEKVRPGQAQMICSSFSRGGTFLATGSVDHHVRVYYMKGDDGPQRILENEAHRDRVDSIQWAHSGLRLVSGSKDGTAIIWWFETQQWKTMVLNMTTKLNNSSIKKNGEDAKKVKVTMVTWDLTDQHVITAVSDHTIKVWNSTNGQLDKILTGHRDEVYVMESHPHDSNIILSAGHDGQLFVWDIFKGEIIARYLNTIEGQGYGAIFDVKWSPDGCTIAATDSHGHLLTFGFGTGSPFYEHLPKELFFHTDYRPLVRDSNHFVLDEQTQLPPHLMPPPFLVDIDGNPYPPTFQRLVPGREHCNVEQLVPNIVIGNEGTQEVIQDISDTHNLEEADIRGNSSFRTGRRNRDMERIRQSTGDWQTDPNMEWKRNILVPPLRKSMLHEAKELIEVICKAEIDEYLKQLRQRPHMICTSTPNMVQKEKKEKKTKNISNVKYQTRSTRIYVIKNDISESSELSESSGYSDWMAEEGVNLQPPKRSKRRQVIQNKLSDDDDDDDDDDEDDDDDDEDDDDDDEDEEDDIDIETVEKERKKREKLEVPNKITAQHTLNANHTNNSLPSTSAATNQPRRTTSKLKISEKYRLSEWLTETRPRKSPYYPQMGDEIVYFIQGHQLYLDAVKLKNIYEISAKDLPWTKMTIKDIEFVKVIGIQYEIRPPRLCCLKLAMLDEESRLTGKIFTVKYHDMPDVLDFFVLKQTYTISVSRNWLPNEKFRCMIDDEWWFGEIMENSPKSDQFPNSPFMCFDIKWNNEERERMSPWDMEPVDEERLPEDENKALPVLENELASILYKPVAEDWPGTDRDSACKFILAGLTKVMELAIAEPFLVPVDLSIYPTYAMIIEYPIDLSTIKARFENNFYRRLTAAQFDIRYLATNAEKFNERHSVIVKHARILTELCLRIVKQCTNYVDVQPLYHQLVEGYDSSDTEDEIEIMPSSSRSLRSLPNRYFKHANDWKLEAKNLIDGIWDCEDSVPFRAPVNSVKYPDYHLIVKNPMDLGTIRENLLNEKYDTPNQFACDVRLIFQNSRTYNTNNRSRIYVMTVRLAAIFEEHINKIIYNWKIAKRRETRKNSESSASSSTASSSSSSSSNKDDNNSIKLASNAKKHIVADNTETDEEDDDLPLTTFKTMNNKFSESDNNSEQNKMKPTTSSGSKKQTSDDEDDSEDSYKPVIQYKRNNRNKQPQQQQQQRNESEESSETDNDDYVEEEEMSTDDSGNSNSYQTRRKSARQRRPVRRKVNHNEDSNDSSDSDDLLSNIRARKRRRYLPVESDDNSDGDEIMNGDRDSTYFTTVSSRGRVRKLTPRVQALMRKDKKLL